MTFLLWAPAAYLMGRALYVNNICHCPSGEAVDVAARTNASLTIVPIFFVVILGVLAVGGRLAPPAGAARRAVAVPPKTFDTYVWQFMRWSGVLLIPLVWMHVALQDVLLGVHHIDINFVALRWALLGWRIYDVALLGFAFGHGMLGLRSVVTDYVTHPGWNRALRRLLLLGWLVLTAIGMVAVFGGVQK